MSIEIVIRGFDPDPRIGTRITRMGEEAEERFKRWWAAMLRIGLLREAKIETIWGPEQQRVVLDLNRNSWIETDERVGVRVTHPTASLVPPAADAPGTPAPLAGLTPAEARAFDALADAIQAIQALPVCHPADMDEDTRDFHNLQNRLLARAAVRLNPTALNHVEGFE